MSGYEAVCCCYPCKDSMYGNSWSDLAIKGNLILGGRFGISSHEEIRFSRQSHVSCWRYCDMTAFGPKRTLYHQRLRLMPKTFYPAILRPSHKLLRSRLRRRPQRGSCFQRTMGVDSDRSYRGDTVGRRAVTGSNHTVRFYDLGICWPIR